MKIRWLAVHRHLLIVLVLATGSGFPRSVEAQTMPTLVGTTGFGRLNQPPRALAVSGDRIYTADEYGLSVYDISEARPRRVDELLLPDRAGDLALSGRTVYLADGKSGLKIVDVSNAPTLVGSCATSSHASAVTVSGARAYVSVESHGLDIIDVSDPVHPVMLGHVDTPGWAEEAVVVDTTVYIADGGKGLAIVDVADPAHPLMLGNIETNDYVYGVVVSGTMAYLADGNNGLTIVDVSDSADPELLGNIDPGYLAYGIAVSGNTVYLAASSQLTVIDVGDPADPRILGECDHSRYLKDLTLVGNSLWGADFGYGLEKFDVSDPSNPSLETSLFTAGVANDVVASGNFVYVADHSAGLQIRDVTDPVHPVAAGGLPLRGWTISVAVSGVTAYVGDDWGNFNIIDVSDPASPQMLAEAYVSDDVRDINVSGGIACLACQYEGLRIFDVANPEAPRLLGGFDFPDPVVTLARSGNILFVGTTSSIAGLDISDPCAPKLLASVSDLGITYNTRMTVSGSMLLIPDEGNLDVFDISEPTRLSLLGVFDSEQYITGVSMVGATALTVSSVGWQMVDLSNPAAPGLLFAYDRAPRSPTGLAVDRENGTFWLSEGPLMEGFALGIADCPNLEIIADPSTISAGGAHATLRVRVTDGEGNPLGGVALAARPASGSLSAFTETGNGFYTADYNSGERVGWIEIPISVAGTQCGSVGSIHVGFPADPRLDTPLPGNFRVIPAGGHLPGAYGTSWRSDAVLHNPGIREASAALFFLESGQDNSRSIGHVVTVSAGGSLELDDFVLNTFGRASASGAVFLSSDEPLFVTSRTYNDASSGTYGQLVPGIDLADAIRGDTAVRLIQLTRNTRYRTNIGFVNTADTPLHVRVELFNADGTALGSPDYDIAPMSFFQQSDILGTHVEDAWALITSDTSDARYFSYASVVDNHSGDPIFVLPVSATHQELMIPAAASVHGLAGTSWRTDIELHNTGSAAAEIDVDALLRDRANTNPASLSFSVEPGTGIRLEDVLGQEFGISGAAALRIRVNTFQDIMVTSRTYNDAGTETYGQFIPALPADAAGGAARDGRLLQLSQSDSDETGFRTNIGLSNATEISTEVRISLYDGAGNHLGDVSQHLEAFEYVQIDRIFRRVTENAVNNGYAIVTSSTPGAGIFAYASVVDNRSGDSIYLPAMW